MTLRRRNLHADSAAYGITAGPIMVRMPKANLEAVCRSQTATAGTDLTLNGTDLMWASGASSAGTLRIPSCLTLIVMNAAATSNSTTGFVQIYGFNHLGEETTEILEKSSTSGQTSPSTETIWSRVTRITPVSFQTSGVGAQTTPTIRIGIAYSGYAFSSTDLALNILTSIRAARRFPLPFRVEDTNQFTVSGSMLSYTSIWRAPAGTYVYGAASGATGATITLAGMDPATNGVLPGDYVLTDDGYWGCIITAPDATDVITLTGTIASELPASTGSGFKSVAANTIAVPATSSAFTVYRPTFGGSMFSGAQVGFFGAANIIPISDNTTTGVGFTTAGSSLAQFTRSPGANNGYNRSKASCAYLPGFVVEPTGDFWIEARWNPNGPDQV